MNQFVLIKYLLRLRTRRKSRGCRNPPPQSRQINGQIVNNEPELRGQIAHYQPGDNISIAYTRDGKQSTANVQLTNYSGTLDILKEEGASKLLGATFRALTRDEKSQFNINGGLLLTDPGSGQPGRVHGPGG